MVREDAHLAGLRPDGCRRRGSGDAPATASGRRRTGVDGELRGEVDVNSCFLERRLRADGVLPTAVSSRRRLTASMCCEIERGEGLCGCARTRGFAWTKSWGQGLTGTTAASSNSRRASRTPTRNFSLPRARERGKKGRGEGGVRGEGAGRVVMARGLDGGLVAVLPRALPPTEGRWAGIAGRRRR